MKLRIKNPWLSGRQTRFYVVTCSFAFCVFIFASICYAQVKKEEPLTVNGDVVEYSTDKKEITASGHVEIIFKGAVLTCEKITVNTQTKEAVAEGNPKLTEERGIIEGAKIIYNFETKTGTILDSRFRAAPYYGRAKKLEKLGESEYVAQDGFATTCSFDKPHYRIRAKQINIVPGNKIRTKGDTIYFADAPVMYLPRFNRSLKDNLMHVKVIPGSRKDWGPFLLSAWRYNLTDSIDGMVYLDYRNRLGVAEGFGLNYRTANFGKGDYKFYYTNEESDVDASGNEDEFQRYFNRWRHKWDIDERTNFISEVYQISDEKRKVVDPQVNFLKDYFYREYEKDSQPLSYALLHHSFQYSSVDFLVQKRINRWFDQLDKLPEVKYSLPSLKIADTPIYFENSSAFATLSKKDTTIPVTPDEVDVTRLDTTNKFSLPFKMSILRLRPFVANRQTLYDKGADDSRAPIRSIFYSGLELSTKFFRIFDVKSNFLKMGIEGLRHIITPTVSYNYNHEPTITANNLSQVDSVDSITRNNSANLELSNKLQTKRNGQSVDLVDFRVNSSYIFKPNTGDKLGSNFSDTLFKMTLLPYTWLRVDGDATYKHSGDRSEEGYNRFINANYDFVASFAKERSLGIGQRYQRKGGNEITYNFQWRLNPKWLFSSYHRYNMGHDPSLRRGWVEQQYGVVRDLHCWTVGASFDTKRNEGTTIWVVFRLKAFPEMEVGFDQSYSSPKSGVQTNP